MKRYGHIIEEILDDANIIESIHYVVRGKNRKNSFTGKQILSDIDKTVQWVKERVVDGSYKPDRYRQIIRKERGKERKIQCIPLRDRILMNAIMKVVERYVNRTIPICSAASIKGRGGHFLHKMMRDYMLSNQEETAWTYKCDIRKFYENIPQEKAIDVFCRYFKDDRLIRIVTSCIRMLPSGLSIGLHTSQCIANLYLSHYIDHILKDKLGAVYYRYMDDIVIQAPSKRVLTYYIRELKKCIDNAGLEVKSNESVFKTEKRGVDFLGYVTYSNGNVRLRKRTVHRFAKCWNRANSIERKVKLVGAFYGISKHAKAKHLFKKITGCDMRQFADLGLVYESEDGIQYFDVPYYMINDIINRQIIVNDVIDNAKTKNGERMVIKFSMDGIEGKFMTGSKEMRQLLNKAKDGGLMPFTTTIKRKNIGQNASKFVLT